MQRERGKPIKTRGTHTNPAGRFESTTSAEYDDGWESLAEPLPSIETTIQPEAARSIITRNDSPDVGFSQSINPYRGCEHGCVYCYARPAHAYMDLSPGLDFETRLFYKPDAARLLEEELRKPGYACKLIHIGGNTDPYQPIERELKITRALLEVLLRFRHPVSIITKGAALMLRDLDLFAELARHNLISTAVSVTSLDDELKRTLEPRTSSARLRLKLIRSLSDAGVPVTVMAAPLIPFVNDAELEAILESAAGAGARSAGYVMLRLPHEVKGLFRTWLESHHPERAAHVMSLVQQMHGGRDYDSSFGHRQTGSGTYAALVAQRFRLACKRLGFQSDDRMQRYREPDHSLFRVPPRAGDQLTLL